MNRADADDTLQSLLISEWNDATPIRFENRPFTKPEDSPWISFIFKGNVTKGETIGSVGHRRFKRVGMIFFQVFVPLYSSTYAGSHLCEDIISIFEGKNIDGIWVYKSIYSPTGPSKYDDYFQFNGSMYVRFDEIK